VGHRRRDESEARFARYMAGLASVIGHADRASPLRDYCVGLMMPCEHKSVEPMAAVTAPERTAAQHQSLLHFVGQAPWSDEKVLAKVREMVLPEIERHGPIEAWIIDDTGFPKKGRPARQAGQLPSRRYRYRSPIACELAGELSAVSAGSVGARRRPPGQSGCSRGDRLSDQAGDRARADARRLRGRYCARRGVAGRRLWQPHEPAPGIGALGLPYVAGILSSTTVWAPGTEPLPPKRWSGRGRRPTRIRRDAKHSPVSAKELALGLPKRAWRTIGWREGTAERLSSRFARVRVRAAHRGERHDEEWLLIEWPKGAEEPTKYWLSTLPQDIIFERLVDLAKLRWRIERDYQELKQEFGLGHYEGRGWRGFHHHATLCIAAYGFLISERGAIPPSGPLTAAGLPKLELPAGYRPRGAADQARTSHPELDRYPAPANDRRSRHTLVEMPLLRPKNRSQQAPPLVTQ
jgi:SRSO17 transposase